MMDLSSMFPPDLCTSPSKRPSCPNCTRPTPSCWCPYLPKPRVTSSSLLLVLQHPSEEKRGIRTARMLELGMADGDCLVYRGTKFPGSDSSLGELLGGSRTFLLYPGKGARDIRTICGEEGTECLVQDEDRTERKVSKEDMTDVQVKDEDRPDMKMSEGMAEDRTDMKVLKERTEGQITDKDRTVLVLLDGTWDQARKMFARSPLLQNIPRVFLSLDIPSEYVVRTQPMRGCISTLEAGAHSLAMMEGKPEVVDALLGPLRAMCRLQINHGAVIHDDKEAKQANMDFVKRKPQYPDP